MTICKICDGSGEVETIDRHIIGCSVCGGQGEIENLPTPAPGSDAGERDVRALARMVWLLIFNDDYEDEERLLALRRNSPLAQELAKYFEQQPWTAFDKTVAREKRTDTPKQSDALQEAVKAGIAALEYFLPESDNEFSKGDGQQCQHCGQTFIGKQTKCDNDGPGCCEIATARKALASLKAAMKEQG